MIFIAMGYLNYSMNDFDKEWMQFMIENKKWDSKKGEWRIPRFNEYHNKLKTIEVKAKREDGSEYTYLQQEFDGWEMGPIMFKYCQLCSKNLDEMRNSGKKVVKFCCKDHMIEYSKRKKIRKAEFDINTFLNWSTRNGDRIFRNEIVVNRTRNGEYESFPYRARKSKWARVNPNDLLS